MNESNLRLGIAFIVAATAIFGAQDGITKHLSTDYSPVMVVMIRFWFFAAFTLALAARQPGGVARAAKSYFPKLQVLRGLLLITNIWVMSIAFVKLGLIGTHAVATSYPLMVAALSGPLLGEVVGWRRWAAVGVGFLGELIILQPGAGVLSPWAAVPAAGAVMMAVYSLLTRYVSKRDAASTSFFYTGIVGAIGSSAVGFFFWQPMSPGDWGWMALLCVTSATGHYCLIRAYSLAEASAVQPFAYLQLVWISIIGVTVYHEALRPNVALGVLIVVGAGLFTLWRQRVRARTAG